MPHIMPWCERHLILVTNDNGLSLSPVLIGHLVLKDRLLFLIMVCLILTVNYATVFLTYLNWMCSLEDLKAPDPPQEPPSCRPSVPLPAPYASQKWLILHFRGSIVRSGFYFCTSHIPTPLQCDQIASLCFKFGPFTTMRLCLIP